MTIDKYEIIPERYCHLLTQEKYTEVIELCQDYLSRHGNVTKLEDGVISFEDSNGENQIFALDNLVRVLHDENYHERESIIIEHFTAFFNDSEGNYHLDKLDNIKELLMIRVYPDGYLEHYNTQDESIYMVDFEDTKSVLVFDFPNKFVTVEKKEFKNWGLTLNEVFKIAQQNVNKQQVDIIRNEYENGFELFSFFSAYYSVSFLIDLKNNAQFAIGKYGALVSIPTRGSAFVHPINENDIALVIGDIHGMVCKFYDEDPGSITVNYYWYFNGVFTKFPIVSEIDGDSSFHLPNELQSMLNDKK